MNALNVCRDGSPGSILGSVLVFKFLNGMLYALAEAVTPFGAIVLSYSDPIRDKSFCSKAVVTGTMIILGQIYAALALTDAARYYDLWSIQASSSFYRFTSLTQVLFYLCTS